MTGTMNGTMCACSGVTFFVCVVLSNIATHSIGTGLIGGMIGATTLALFFVPLFFVLIESLAERLRGKKKAEPHG